MKCQMKPDFSFDAIAMKLSSFVSAFCGEAKKERMRRISGELATGLKLYASPG